MHVVIMGCGRVGSRLAKSLVEEGHTVAVVDQAAESFRRLGEDFPGATVHGVGFDRDTLLAAGIERADGFAAVSSGDNSNIISARVARETFGVQNVVARIYDPRRAEVYQRLGIPTVAAVTYTANQVKRRLMPAGAEPQWRDPSGRVVLAEMAVHPGWIGLSMREIAARARCRVAYLTRYGEAKIPYSADALQDGDLVHVMAAVDDVRRLEDTFAVAPPPQGD